MADCSGGSVAKKPDSYPMAESYHSGRKSSGDGASASGTDSKKKGNHGG